MVKEALCLSSTEETFLNEVLLATAGVYFPGTPHRGSKVASIGKTGFGLSKMLFQDPSLKVLRALEVESEVLERVRRDFSRIMREGKVRVRFPRGGGDQNGDDS